MESQLSGPCAQCSDTRNLYIKTCDCSKKANITHGPLTSEGCGDLGDIKSQVTVDTKQEVPSSQESASKLRAVKAVVYKVIRVYESTPSKTMKYVALISALILFFGVLSLVLAQRDESVQSKYGMAFPLDDAASSNSEKRIAPEGVPGESIPARNEAKEQTTIAPPPAVPSTEEPVVTVTVVTDETAENKKIASETSESSSDELSPAILIGGEDDDKSEDGDQNPKIVFIERLMGLHVSAPVPRPDGQQGDQAREDDKEQGSNNVRNPLDKVNAKWASRMRKFSIPIPSQTDSQPQNSLQAPEQANPMLRYAAAAMMSRLVAAAARAQMEAQAREAAAAATPRLGAKDKDDENDEETVPVIVATMRDEHSAGPQIRPLPPMYGRPMPRPPMMRPPVMPFAPHNQIQRQMASMPHRAFLAPPQQQQQQQHQPQRPPMNLPMGPQRRSGPVQPVLVMLAVPLHNQESRQQMQAVQAPQNHMRMFQAPMMAPRAPMPFYPSVPYSVPYGSIGYHPHMASSYAVPVHVPVPVHYPSPYYQRPVYHYPVQRQMGAYSHVRPVIEVPVEVPVPVHYPMQMQAAAGLRQQIMAAAAHEQGNRDHEPSGSDPDHIVLLYDAEIHHDAEGDDLESSASEGQQQQQQLARLLSGVTGSGPKGHQFLSRPMPEHASPNKMKLWRELIGAKHAAQPGVRYIPVSISSSEESHPQASSQSSHGSQFPHHQFQAIHNGPARREHVQESAPQPAFIVLADPEEQ